MGAPPMLKHGRGARATNMAYVPKTFSGASNGNGTGLRVASTEK